jgi:hypothetical protein
MPYSAQGTFINVSGVRRDQQFRLNSIFDPDYSGTGHQPLAHDQWALFYNHYVVTKCSWEVTIVPQVGNVVAGFYVSDDAAIPTASASNLTELGAQTGLGTPQLPITLRGEVDVGEWLKRGASGGLTLDSSLRSTFGADPSEVIFGTLFASVVSGTATQNVDYLYTLTFDVILMEPKDLAQS